MVIRYSPTPSHRATGRVSFIHASGLITFTFTGFAWVGVWFYSLSSCPMLRLLMGAGLFCHDLLVMNY